MVKRRHPARLLLTHKGLVAAALAAPTATIPPRQLAGQFLAVWQQHNEAPLAVLVCYKCHALAAGRRLHIRQWDEQVVPE